MNYDEALSAGGRSASRVRPPVTFNRSLGESSVRMRRGFRGGGRSSPSRSPGNGPAQVFVKKSSQASNVGSVEKGVQQKRMSEEDNVGSTKQPDEVAALKFSEHNQSYLQSSVPSSSSVPRECEDDKAGARMSCDLVNRMEDVSLSGRVAVPSTSDKEVELSSVEDHDTAHTSGDVGNASNESNSRPFDLCLEKKGMGLKPSFFELNRERRRATKGYTGIVIRPGMVLLQNYLSINDQVTVDRSFYEPSDATSFLKDYVIRPCYIARRMKYVSMSCQDSLSSFCQKVELSNVEGHDIAHQSDDAVKSSNESNTRPFDLCLEKKEMKPRPSLFQLNREKRRATKGYTGIVIRPGMVLLQNYLSINDQVMIVKKCRQLGLGEGGFYQPSYQGGGLLHLKMMCLGKNWDCETRRYGDTRPFDGSTPPQIPSEFSQLVEKAIKDSQSIAATCSKKKKGEDEIPFMSPDICIANFYTSTGRLGLHQDKGESAKSIRKGLPIVSFSIGDSAEFLFGDHRDGTKAETVILQSGDVLLFGGKSRNVFHGVRSILKDTAPRVLVQ